MKFSNREIKDLCIAGAMISLAFAILLSGGYKSLTSLNYGLIIAFFIAFLTAGIGFLFHELMHKYIAQKYGLSAEFKAFYPMLWLALLFSFFGFILAAPGAVFISGFVTRKRNGKISVAGPVTNIVLAIIFLVLFLVFKPENQILAYLFQYGLSINSLLAAFNMLPVMPFDGAKVIAWNKTAYFVTLGIGIALFVISWII